MQIWSVIAADKLIQDAGVIIFVKVYLIPDLQCCSDFHKMCSGLFTWIVFRFVYMNSSQVCFPSTVLRFVYINSTQVCLHEPCSSLFSFNKYWMYNFNKLYFADILVFNCLLVNYTLLTSFSNCCLYNMVNLIQHLHLYSNDHLIMWLLR